MRRRVCQAGGGGFSVYNRIWSINCCLQSSFSEQAAELDSGVWIEDTPRFGFNHDGIRKCFNVGDLEDHFNHPSSSLISVINYNSIRFKKNVQKHYK